MKPRFPDPLSSAEKLKQLPLVTQFFAGALKNPSISDIGNAQMLVKTLGAVHALSNPLSVWQSVKGWFSFIGNRKGQLTPRLNEHIFKGITAACTPTVAASVKDHVLQRSKQVKTGIRAKKGKKSFEKFGEAELATYAGLTSDIGPLVVQDLMEVNPVSISMNSASLNGHLQTYDLHRKNTTNLESHAQKMLNTIVNPVDEEE
jgi:hypothetical protein